MGETPSLILHSLFSFRSANFFAIVGLFLVSFFIDRSWPRYIDAIRIFRCE